MPCEETSKVGIGRAAISSSGPETPHWNFPMRTIKTFLEYFLHNNNHVELVIKMLLTSVHVHYCNASSSLSLTVCRSSDNKEGCCKLCSSLIVYSMSVLRCCGIRASFTSFDCSASICYVVEIFRLLIYCLRCTRWDLAFSKTWRTGRKTRSGTWKYWSVFVNTMRAPFLRVHWCRLPCEKPVHVPCCFCVKVSASRVTWCYVWHYNSRSIRQGY